MGVCEHGHGLAELGQLGWSEGHPLRPRRGWRGRGAAKERAPRSAGWRPTPDSCGGRPPNARHESACRAAASAALIRRPARL
eukprot:scaffold1183_cov418-Prasinococcus_capsulatus_cf.AAC.1